MFKQLDVKAQLSLGFGLVVGLFVAALLGVGLMVATLSDGVHAISEKSLPRALMVDEMNLARSDVQQFLTDVAATHDEAGYKDAENSAQLFRNNVAEFRRQFQAEKDVAKLQELEALSASFETFASGGKLMAQAYLSQGMEAGNLLMKGSPDKPGFDKLSETLGERLEKFRAAEVEAAKASAKEADQLSKKIRMLLLFGGLAAAIAAVVISSLIVRLLLRQLGGEPRIAVRLAQRVGSGDLCSKIIVEAGDSSSLLAQLKHMQTGLVSVVATVRRESAGVAEASAEISDGNNEMSDRTVSHANALEEAAASMDQLNVTVKQNVDGAREAQALASSASQVAQRGGELVSQFVGTMQGINEASRKIGDIIGVIDSIAFQTNILALNAAVEAARAGEQGRGFAVVASEVRSLAGRSAEAAREIKALINTSVERVEQGSSLVDQAAATMSEVVHSIQAVSSIMTNINSASAEQSGSVAQMTAAIHHMENVTQQNVAMVEEMAASASTLRAKAQELFQTVQGFKLAE
ncbi:methyl-accepting chemotaxis protein [Paucibacter sp. TC2R-5]|uniref:methyl-accepting chemotaxis protein n=1 Tax=Paucibacter sp. TC2R-5 TaxID=2893555 RepID=UPI0021E4E313|nr:methyl-accepting chemotaxis protein [Paucibacter sp. TC2R-5]MCV2358600.1 methyl-accepting chemotaxis protein [Paucibacter sp. TC2R-5]